MRLFLIADTHGSVPLLPHSVDAALVCGDFTDFGRTYEPFFDSLQSQGLPVFFTSGNHETADTCREVADRYHVVCLDYDWTVFKNLLLVGVGGFDIFDDSSRSANLDDFLDRLQQNKIDCEGKYSIILSHEPPYPWNYNGKLVGEKKVEAIFKTLPFDLAVCGHFHEYLPRLENDAGNIPILNPSADGCIVDIDAKTKQFRVIVN